MQVRQLKSRGPGPRLVCDLLIIIGSFIIIIIVRSQHHHYIKK